MEKTHFFKIRTIKPPLGFLLLAFIVLLFANIALSSCSDEGKDHYISYGLVDSLGQNQYLITLDDGTIVSPKNVYRLQDSLRLIMDFSILSDGDTAQHIKYNIEINALQEVPIEPILAYDQAMLDTLGNNPVEIRNGECWIANGFLTIEFFCVGLPNTQHKVHMMQLPSEDGKIILEFRHDGFDEPKYELRKGYVSFPIRQLLENQAKPVTIEVMYQDSDHRTKTITLNYK